MQGLNGIKAVIGFCFQFMILFAVLILVIFSFLNKESFASSPQFELSKELIKNWETPFINEILVSFNHTCPADYILINNFSWPGVKTICSCPIYYGVLKLYTIIDGECNSNQLSQNCSTHFQNDEVNFQVWKNDKTLCFKRGNTSFSNEDIICNYGKKICSSGEMRVCIDNDEKCPVTYANISNAPIFNNESFSSQQINSSLHLVVSSKEGNYPFVRIELAQEFLCYYSESKNLGKGFFLYKYLNQKPFESCLKEPWGYLIDSIGEEDFYKANNMFDKVLNIPAYPRPSNDNLLKIISKSTFKWTFECRSSKFSNIGTAISQLNSEEEFKSIKILFITTIIAFSIIVLILPLIAYIYFTFDKQLPEQLENIFMLLELLSKMALFAMLVLSIWIIGRSYSWFNAILQMDCADSFVNEEILIPFKDYLENTVQKYLICLLLIVSLLVKDIFESISICRIDLKNKISKLNSKKMKARAIDKGKLIQEFKFQENSENNGNDKDLDYQSEIEKLETQPETIEDNHSIVSLEIINEMPDTNIESFSKIVSGIKESFLSIFKKKID